MSPTPQHTIPGLQSAIASAVYSKYQRDLYSLDACEDDYEEAVVQENKLLLGLLQSEVKCKHNNSVPKVPELTSNQVNIDSFHNPSFTFVQSVPTGIWLIRHNLNCNPQVQVRDTSGNVLTPQIAYPNPVLVQLTFNTLVAGKAYLYQTP